MSFYGAGNDEGFRRGRWPCALTNPKFFAAPRNDILQAFLGKLLRVQGPL
jgi:hypothetical protein